MDLKACSSWRFPYISAISAVCISCDAGDALAEAPWLALGEPVPPSMAQASVAMCLVP